MARNVRVDILENVSSPIVGIRHDYQRGHIIKPHAHRRSQLLCGFDGVMIVTTHQGAWVIPPHRGVWIPGGLIHSVRLIGAASTLSLYIEPVAVATMPTQCRVVEISPFVQSLVVQMIGLPVESEPGSRADALTTLLLHELKQLPVLPLALALPRHAGLLRRCEFFLAQPQIHETIDSWTAGLGMSRRAFTRLFRAETGLSFAEWRQQACVAAALPRLAAGETITRVAFDLGYDNPAAFTAMFKRQLGASPRHYASIGDSAVHELERAETDIDAMAGHHVSMRRIRVRAGQAGRFERCWSDRQKVLSRQPGFVALHLLRDSRMDGDSDYMVITVWLTAEDRAAWHETEAAQARPCDAQTLRDEVACLPASGDFLLVDLA